MLLAVDSMLFPTKYKIRILQPNFMDAVQLQNVDHLNVGRLEVTLVVLECIYNKQSQINYSIYSGEIPAYYDCGKLSQNK